LGVAAGEDVLKPADDHKDDREEANHIEAEISELGDGVTEGGGGVGDANTIRVDTITAGAGE